MMKSTTTDQYSLLNSDASILAEIWSALHKYETIRALDMDSFSIAVDKGSVLLTGHVSKKYHHDLIAEIAHSTPGVSALHNNLVVDADLTFQVAERLARDERTQEFIIPVGCTHGWIRLGGEVPTRELQLATEQISAEVPSVRGILSRPRVIGESPEAQRQPLQPHINTKIYDYNRQEGLVTQVVIQPRNRLITHVVVRTSGFDNGSVVSHEYVLPLESLEVVNPDSLFVKRNGPPLSAFPAFDASNYPLAPADWTPPYPYTTGEVRWPCETE